MRVVRGGSWLSILECVRVAFRDDEGSRPAAFNLGFRLCFAGAPACACACEKQLEGSTMSEVSVNAVSTSTSDRPAGHRRVVTIKGVEVPLRWAPPGEYMMGSPADEVGRFADEEQRHVVIEEGFWVMETQVTQELWEAVVGTNPSAFKGPRRPVECVSYDDIQAALPLFEAALKEALAAEGGAKDVDAPFLPTEEQWEYFARAGTTGARYGDLDEIAVYGTSATADVGTKRPNPWGLFDVLGNVWEWTRSLWSERHGS